MPLPAKVEALTFGKENKCGETSVTTVEPGQLTLEIIDQPAFTHDGTLRFVGTKIKLAKFGLECLYLAEHAGTLTGGEESKPATIDPSGTLKRVGGGFFCPTQAKYLGFYKVTSPFSLWVSM